jgi:hypothetical protein
MAEDANDKKKAKAIRQMKKTEQQRWTYQKWNSRGDRFVMVVEYQDYGYWWHGQYQ